MPPSTLGMLRHALDTVSAIPPPPPRADCQSHAVLVGSDTFIVAGKREEI